jgi:hypothetical protein
MRIFRTGGLYGLLKVEPVIPSFCIRLRSVLGWRSRILAAPFGLSITPPPVCSEAATM